ncbi:acetate/propionate family kinase [Aeoliella sp. ICT_H6.2]|uniref:Acetate kinase n=1 Tax=Aeoliella straminimaris TaxID=2954799 RepID=A0A9X2FA35_9BACT|nr:acetate/propionate family kinase [Aeoliella straminimaris]MCO6044408.1 acetate/propionate family kinase [Aeoliella straminimaris]
MKVLIANLGSTSFKYRLFDMDGERQLARGGVERIGAEQSSAFVEIGDSRREITIEAPNHAAAVEQCLAQLTDPSEGCLASADEVSAIGFKAVHGGRARGVRRVDSDVLAAMEEMATVAPAHNPPYTAAMRQLQEALPHIPLVAAFETGFHETIPPRLKHYAIPTEWAEEFGIKRWGFHGASHRYVAGRTAELTGNTEQRVISCHLGGSSSVCAIRNGESVATSMGMSPQSGPPQNNRAGDFDPFALPLLMERTGTTLEGALGLLASQCGLKGLSGTSGDVRDLATAADAGDERAKLALDVFTTSVRHYLGAYLVELGGVDVLAFAGGIGENGTRIRSAICSGLSELGIVLDEEKNAAATGEGAIHAAESKTQIWIVPTNEELVVARQTRDLLEQS